MHNAGNLTRGPYSPGGPKGCSIYQSDNEITSEKSTISLRSPMVATFLLTKAELKDDAPEWTFG